MVANPEAAAAREVHETLGDTGIANNIPVQDNTINYSTLSVEEMNSENYGLNEAQDTYVTENNEVEWDSDLVDFDNPEEVQLTEGQYDFSRYSEMFDLTNPEVVNTLNENTQALRELGFTQAQLEYYLDDMINLKNQISQKPQPTVEEIKEKLNTKLTVEEKRNYNSIKNWVRQAAGNDAEVSQLVNQALGNSQIVKILNAIYKSNLGGNYNPNSYAPEPTNRGGIPLDNLAERFNSWLISEGRWQDKETKKAYLKELRNHVNKAELSKFDAKYRDFLNQK